MEYLGNPTNNPVYSAQFAAECAAHDALSGASSSASIAERYTNELKVKAVRLTARHALWVVGIGIVMSATLLSVSTDYHPAIMIISTATAAAPLAWTLKALVRRSKDIREAKDESKSLAHSASQLFLVAEQLTTGFSGESDN